MLSDDGLPEYDFGREEENDFLSPLSLSDVGLPLYDFGRDEENGFLSPPPSLLKLLFGLSLLPLSAELTLPLYGLLRCA